MRCKSRAQASKGSQSQANCLSYNLTKSRQWFVKKTRTATLVVLLGLGGGFWITTEAIAPQIVQAQLARLERSLIRQPEETYEDLLGRAEAAANTEAQASFDQGDGVTNVAITILAQNQGQIAPILSLQVSRDEWFNQPDAQRWATYFTNARVLLGFEDVAATTSDQPYTDTTNATPEQPPTDTPANTGTQDIDGAAGQSGTTFTTPNSNTTTDDGSATPSSDTTTNDGSATPSSDTTTDDGSLLTPQPAVPVTPQLSNPENNNSTTETPTIVPQAPPEQPSTSDTTSDGVDD